MGGLTLRLRAPAGVRGAALPSSHRAFAASRGADIRLELTQEPVPEPPAAATLFDSGAVWRVSRHAGGLLYTFRTPALDPPLYKAVAIDRGLRRGRLFFPRPRRGRRPAHALDFPLDELLFQHRLARDGALEVHASGLLAGGGALVFCGASGAGKSTTARLWRRHRAGVRVLSDDRLVLRPGARRVTAYGTPWHGDGGFAAPLARPVAALYFLRHGPRTRVRALGRAEAAARLLARCFPPPWDATAIARALAACDRIAARVPCAELAFRPDATAVAAVLAHLGAGRSSRASHSRR